MNAPAAVATPDDARSRPGHGDHDLTPAPPSLGASARISTVDTVVTVPAAWLDRLIDILHELPFDQGRDAVARAICPALERAIPDVRAALAMPVKRASGAVPLSSRHVLWTEPPESDERLRTIRMFPEAAHERAVSLPGAFAGAALHFASDDDVFASPASPHFQALERAATIAAEALARSHADEHRATLEAKLRTTEAQMVQAEKLASLGQIAAGMVHELNNPLTSIAAYTDFLLRRAVSREGADPDDIERLRRIAESANRMLRFTRDLVSYARPSGDIPIAVELNVVIERALAFCEHELVDVGVTVLRSFDAEAGSVRGLPEQLAQVFVNLITNACHAMARSSEGIDAPNSSRDSSLPSVAPRLPVLTLTTSRGRDEVDGRSVVVVVVEDSGCGISAKHLALVFNPFFTTKAAGRGTGLGLSIVKNIVEGHGGRIRAESDTSVGTRFVLSFPSEDGPR